MRWIKIQKNHLNSFADVACKYWILAKFRKIALINSIWFEQSYSVRYDSPKMRLDETTFNTLSKCVAQLGEISGRNTVTLNILCSTRVLCLTKMPYQLYWFHFLEISTQNLKKTTKSPLNQF